MSASLSYRPDIDGLRAVSVVVVMLFHLGVTTMSGGFVGVDVFFVISGFLITSIIAREIDAGTFTFAAFYERRIRRIYPALIVVLLATFAGALLVTMPRDFVAFTRTLIAAPLFAANFMFLGGEGYFDPASTTKPLLHIWSLGVEEQFYIVFPWLLMWAARRGGTWRTKFVAGVVAGSMLVSVIGGLFDWRNAYFLLPTRFFELGIGALVALARPRLGRGLRGLLGVAGLAAIAVSCLVFDEATVFPGWAALVPCLGAAGVIFGEGGPVARLLAWRPIVYVGRISYPMYLWHWPPIVFVLAVTGRPIEPATAVVLFALTVALSAATYHLIETPLRSRRWLATRGRLFAGAGIASAMVAGLGIAGFVGKGWPDRLSAEEAALARVATERTSLETLCPHGRRDMGKDLPPCFLGDRTRERLDFAVLGDSHARALAGEISAAATDEGLKGIYLGRVACSPLTGIERTGDSTRRCGEHLAWALERIRTLDPPTVVLIGRWGGLAGETAVAHERRDPVIWAEGGRIVPRGEVPAAIGRGFAATLDALAGRRVVVLGAIPEPGYDVPMVRAAALRFGRTPPPDPSRADHQAKQAGARAWMAPALAGRANVRVVDPADVLCASGVCAAMAHGAPLYVDDNHPSRVGGGLVAKALAPALK
ncbi:MAG: acyltransferase [Siculibacillus sp.]|nr:acyltransferase [Siculibacillus sp.]